MINSDLTMKSSDLTRNIGRCGVYRSYWGCNEDIIWFLIYGDKIMEKLLLIKILYGYYSAHGYIPMF